MEYAKQSKTIELTKRKKVDMNEYKGKSYIHFNDRWNHKSFSFTSAEFKLLMDHKEEIEQYFVFLNRRREKYEEENHLNRPSRKRSFSKRFSDEPKNKQYRS